MIILPDLDNHAAPVKIRGVDIQPRGLGLHDIIVLMTEVPDLTKVFDGSGKTSFMTLIIKNDTLLKGIIMRGAGLSPESAASLDASEEASLIGPILEQTVRAGIGPFVRLMETAAKVLDPEIPGNKELNLAGVDHEKIRAAALAGATRSMKSREKPSPSSSQDSTTML